MDTRGRCLIFFHRGLKLGGRLLLGLIGALSGLMAGLGCSLVVTQSGVAVEWVPTLSIAGIAFGFVWGFSAPTKLLNRIGAIAALGAVLFTTFAGFQPAQAQEGDCIDSMQVAFEGGSTDLLMTTQQSPAIIPIDQDTFSFSARVSQLEDGVLRVLASEEGNRLIRLDSEEALLWHGRIEGGAVTMEDRIVSEGGVAGYSLQNAGITIPPWGRYRAEVSISEIRNGSLVQVCSEEVWLQFAAMPFATPIGVGGAVIALTGLLGFSLLEPLRGRLSRGRADEPKRPEPVVTRQAVPIRRLGPPDCLDVHFEVDEGSRDWSRSRPLDPKAALVKGQTYRLVVTIEPGIDADIEELDEDYPLTIVGSSKGFKVRPSIELSFFGAKKGIPIEVLPEKVGRHRLSVDIFHNGQLLRTEHLTVSVVEPGANTLDQPEPTTRAALAPSLFVPNELRRRERRALCLILESDPTDGSVNLRAHADGQTICTIDSRSAPESVANESHQAREALARIVALWAEESGQVPQETATAELVNLAIAGRYLHRALFPKGEVVEGSIEAVTERIAEGATIQINHFRSGMGRATLPWGLVYDRTLRESGSGNTICDAFPHPNQVCPNESNRLVVCPSGFWGYRATIEQPESEVQTELLVPPIVSTEPGLVVSYLMSGLDPASETKDRLERVAPVEWVDNLESLMMTLETSPGIAGVYIYTHDASVNDRPALVVGSAHLTPLSLDGFEADWEVAPVVFLNACSTGAAFPENALTMIRAFRVAGAAGVVATECPVFHPSAGELGADLFRRGLSGDHLGPALLSIRRSLLEDLNPLGLAYAIHGPVDQPISVLRPAPAEARS